MSNLTKAFDDVFKDLRTGPYASEEETAALIKPDTRSPAEKRLQQLIEAESVPELCGSDYSQALYKAALKMASQPTPMQHLPFSVGGGLVAVKMLLSRDPCIHANTAIEMIDAILKQQPVQPADQSEYCLNCEELSKELAALKKQPQIACCAECGKKDSDGWALYCVDCMDKIHALFDSAEKKLDALIAQNTPTPSPKNHGDI